ncbi:MAG: hypothetical protein V3W19_05385 [Desulfatiglandales bacterium]
MNRRQYVLMLTLALIGGLIGGAISTRLFMDKQAFAQKSLQHEKIIVAEEFRLVDEQEKTRAILGLSSQVGQPGLWLNDKNGRVRVSLILDPKQQPALFFADSAERVRTEFRVEKGLVSDEEYPSLIFRDADQNVRTHLMPGLWFLRGKSPSLSQLELSTYFLRLTDKDGGVLWAAP